MNRIPWVICLLGLPILIASWAAWDDSFDLRSLNALTPVINYLITIGDLYSKNSHTGVVAVVGLVTCGVISLLIGASREKILFYIACLFAVFAQACLLFSNVSLGITLYMVSAVVAFSSASKGEDILVGENSTWNRSDYVTVIWAMLIAVIFRGYAINVLPDYFEGELSPYSAAATSIPGWFIANRGMWGPWAPLGILYYIPIYISTSLFGTTFAALRLSSMLVGAFTIPILYLFLREFGGRALAQLGAFLLALNQLHIGWGRTDIHPHGVTLWPAILVALFTLRVLRGQGRFYLFFLALSMGLSWHQYPSGQSAVLIPILSLCLLWILRALPKSIRARHLLGVISGGALWYLGLPISYLLADGSWTFPNPFTLTTQRTSWGNTSFSDPLLDRAIHVLGDAWVHLIDVVEGVFYKVPYLFNQDFLTETPGLSVRTVPWLLAAFIIPGFFVLVRKIRSIEAVIIISWLLVALAPGVFSERAYPKRLSTFFPLIECVAAVALVNLQSNLPAIKRRIFGSLVFIMFAFLFFYTSSAWFSGRSWKYGVPPEVKAAREISNLLEPNTIVLGDVWKNYLEGKLTYLMIDALSDPAHRPNAWLTRWPVGSDGLHLGPVESLVSLQTPSWVYAWNRLSGQLTETINNRSWKHVIYLLQKREEESSEFDRKIVDILSTCLNPKAISLDSEGRQMGHLAIIKCDL